MQEYGYGVLEIRENLVLLQFEILGVRDCFDG